MKDGATNISSCMKPQTFQITVSAYQQFLECFMNNYLTCEKFITHINSNIKYTTKITVS